MRKAAISAAILGSVALSGCSGDGFGDAVGELAQDAAEQAINEATGGEASINLGDGASLPASWPETVPAPEFELQAAAATGSGWTAAATAPSLSVDDYVAQLEDAGFTAGSDVSVQDAARSENLTDGNYSVTASWAKEPGGDSGLLTVVVTEAGGTQ